MTSTLSADAANALAAHGFVVLPGPFSAEALVRLQISYDTACALAAPEDAGLMEYPTTPDGRYFVVRGRLWRCSNPALPPAEREQLVASLMAARRAVARARRAGDDVMLAAAREAVDEAKRALGERGPVWWTDGAPDYNRRLARTTPYAAWFAALAPPAETPAE
jgi:hypothetical protein